MNKIQSKLIVAAGIAGVLFAAVIAVGLNRALLADDSKTGLVLSPYTRTAADWGDFEAATQSAKTDAEKMCGLAVRVKRYADPAAACAVAYEENVAKREFERALRYAAIGCRTLGEPDSCRRVGRLAPQMANAGVPVPAVVAEEIQRTADFVCLSGTRLRTLVGTDITGRECSYFAGRFVLARDPEYAHALEPAARQFFETIYQPARAARLYKAACERFGYVNGCETLRDLSRQVSLRDLDEVTEILEREAGRGAHERIGSM